MLVLFAPAVALAHGNGNGNGGVGGGMGNGNGNGSINGGASNGVGGSSNGNSGMTSSDRAVDVGFDSDTALGRLAQAKKDKVERASTKQLAATDKSSSVSSNAHGKAVSAEAHLAKSENDGDTVGADVRDVAHDKSTLKTHTKTHTKVASTKTHPVNHGADVSAEAHLAKAENDGDTVGADVSAVAKSNSHGHGKALAKGHTKTHNK
jgi:chorismate synthase